jgi:hypothetical protein
MRKTLLLFLILPIFSMAQVMDDFSDGDFIHNPTWIGTDTSFIVNTNLQLQSAASVAGEAWLATVIAGEGRPKQPIYDEMEWRFWIRENFSPSGNNYAEVWLSADTSALTHASYGYFLRFGAAGSQDAIELYRKDPNGEHLICKGADAAIASSFKMAVKVNRDWEGRWKMLIDNDNMGVYALEAEGDDDVYPIEGYFGFYLKFTVSNAKKFYFDDVYVGPKIIDHDPPELQALDVRDETHILLTFNESLDVSALDSQHYLLEPGVVMPDTVRFDERPSKVLLGFASQLPGNCNLQLKVMNISDLSGNILTESTWDFSIYKAAENDVVINEIMADPTPVVGLPEWEYVELFNTTEYAIDLKDWTFNIGTTSKIFPSVQIDPLGFLILCKDDAEEMETYGKTCAFSSFSIANAGAILRLFSPDETLVSEVSFNDNWYHDAEKKNGGWSLEQIDPFNPCAGTINWSASVDASGGTPGRVNSINAPNETVPKVARVSMLGDNIVLLWFDQQMDRESLENLSGYYVKELNINPVEVICNPVESSSLELIFDYYFQEGEVYTLILNGMESCSGQPVEPDTKVCFGIPNEINVGDILINEILFDPISPGVDYVELYNHSDKTFDLSELKLGVIKESFPNPADTVLKEITDESRLMLPHTYLLLSTDGYTVSQQYGCEMENFFDMQSFPSYANSGGVALLMSRQGMIVDQMTFSEKMHYPLLKETKGVALERVSWGVSSDQPDNWHSAVEAVHFGTPGYANSMMNVGTFHEQTESAVTLDSKVFSPDGDGFDDNCMFTYQFEIVSCTMNVYVFNVEGQLVRHLVKGELIGDVGGFVWNGLDDRGNRVPIGIYVVVTEVFDLSGLVRKYKNAVVVASR